MMKTKIAQPPSFDWSTLPVELFRGPGLSFPIGMNLLVSPAFNATVLNATTSFVRDYTGHPLLDAEEDSFPILLTTSIVNRADNKTIKLNSNTLVFQMNFICGSERLVVFTLGQSSPRVLH